MNRKKGIKVTMKLTFVLFMFVVGLAGLGGRVYYIKTVHGEEYEIRAKTQQTSRYDKMIPPNRGSIVDRNKQSLAVSLTVYNIVLDARVLSKMKQEEQEKTLTVLTTAFPQLNYEELKNYITINPETKAPNLDNSWKYLVKKVDRKVKEELEAQNLKGIVYEKDSQRRYPLHSVACHVVGFRQGDSVWGIEKQYENEMSGTPGRSFISYDGTNRAEQQDILPKDGNTVVTTLDYTIQQFAEEAVAQGAAQFPAERTLAMVMNPMTGEVLAMADSHKFDPGDPLNPLEMSDPDFKGNWESMDNKEQLEFLNNSWKNFSVVSTYEPGSIFKPMVVAAALEENIISENSTYYCQGYKQVADRRINCNVLSGHGQLDVTGVLAYSCNVGMMDIANLMGRKIFYKYQRDFGFGSKTGIDLPGEVSASSLMYSEENIGPAELATMSFGQSFNCTSIQALTAFCTLVNGGNLMRPYVVSQVVDKNGQTLQENKPEVIRKVISQETADIVKNQMVSTVEVGTGKKIKIEGYTIGAKTGTAEQGDRKKNEHVLSYIAYLPVENPDIIVMCVIVKPDNFMDGVQTPAYMTKSLLENIIKYKSIEPNQGIETTAASGRKAAGKVYLEDYTGKNLKEAVPALEYAGLNYKIIGSGNLITNQAPHGDMDVEEGSEILLYVTKSEDDTGDIAVPDVKGKSYNDAVTELNDAGLDVEAEGPENGVVVSQKPSGGIFVNSSDTTVVIKLEQKEDD